MNTSKLQKELLENTKGLSNDTLQEIIEFVQFLKMKSTKNSSGSNIERELSLLDSSERDHLISEFKDYKQIYPRE